MAWLSLTKSLPVNWKREIEAIDKDIGPAHYGNVLPIMTVKNAAVECTDLHDSSKGNNCSSLRIFQHKILTNILYFNKRSINSIQQCPLYVLCAVKNYLTSVVPLA